MPALALTTRDGQPVGPSAFRPGLLKPLSLGFLGSAILIAALLGETSGRSAAAAIPVLLLLCAAASAAPSGLGVRRSALLVPAAILLAALALAAWRAPEPWAGRMVLLEWGAGAALAAVLGGWGSAPASVRAISAVAASAAALAVYALYQWAWGLDLMEAACRADPALAGVGPGASDALRGMLSSRLGTREPFGTFALSNTLAGVMLLALPLLCGLAFDRARAGWKAAVLSLSAAASGLVLLLTRSKGAWLAFAAVALAWSLGRAPRRAALWVVASAVLLLGWRLASGGGLASSASFRLGYWAGAGNLILEHPWGGGGLGGFEAGYDRVRPVWARDVKRAHSEPLQVWAEAGIWALAGALWLSWACWSRGREAKAAEIPSERAGWGLAAGALTLLVLLAVPGVLHEALFPGPWARILVAAAMAAAAGLAAWASEGGWGPGTRFGALAGTAAMAVHALGDVDLGVSGAALAFWGLVGALAAASPAGDPAPRRGGAMTGTVLALSALLFLTRAAVPWIEAEGSVEAARNALLRRPGPLGEGTYRDLRSAALGAPARAEAWSLLGEAEERRWRAGETEAFRRSLGARARSAALAPSGSAVRVELSRLCLEGADRDPRLAIEALRWADRAVGTFPAAPRLRCLAASMRREILGVPAFAAASGREAASLRREVDALYREALDLDKRVREPNLKLPGAERAEALSWLSRRP